MEKNQNNANKMNSLFLEIRTEIVRLLKEKQVDINLLSLSLGITRDEFIKRLYNRYNDFTYYLHTLSTLENWEV